MSITEHILLKWFLGADLYSYASHSIIREYLVPDEFRTRLFENYGIDSADKICFLFDELQAVQDYPETAELLDWLATSAIVYVDVGTFQLKALDWKANPRDRKSVV